MATIVYIGNKLAIHGKTPTKISTLGPLLKAEGHTVYYASSKRNKLLRLLNMLVRIYQHRKKADIVLIDTYSTTAFYYAWLCSLLCLFLKKKYIPILNGGNLMSRVESSPVLSNQLFGRSYINIATSSFLYEKFKEEQLNTILIENNIELYKYPFLLRSTVQPKLLWVRAFHKTYNPTMAIKVVEELSKKFPDCQLTMVGPDVDGSMEECKSMCEEKGLYHQVTFTGKLSKKEWVGLSQSSDIFINTTNYDNFPISVLEAMALGMPIVSTNVGGIPYLIKNKDEGLLVDKGDVTAMSDSVQKFLTDHILTEKLSSRARAKAEEYDWVNIKSKWEALFSEVINAR